MKPWEETWRSNRYVIEMDDGPGIRQLGQFIDDWDVDGPTCDRDRADLAACAPELARLLLQCQWDDHCCRFCSAFDAEHDDDSNGHKPDCELGLLLRKAGILPPY